MDRTTGLSALSAGSLAGVDEAGQSLGTGAGDAGNEHPCGGRRRSLALLVWSTPRGLYYRIDTDRYRVLTFDLNIPGAGNILNGSIARVIWKIADESAENVSQDIVINHRSGANVFAKVIADMKTLQLDTAPGAAPRPPAG